MKSVKFVKNSLKFKTAPRMGLLSVRVGVKKYRLPVEARIIAGENYIFLSFPASSELYKIANGDITAMDGEANGEEAYTQLNTSGRGKRGRKKRAAVVLPDTLASALKSIPTGYKLVFDLKTGEPRLAKRRERRKS